MSTTRKLLRRLVPPGSRRWHLARGIKHRFFNWYYRRKYGWGPYLSQHLPDPRHAAKFNTFLTRCQATPFAWKPDDAEPATRIILGVLQSRPDLRQRFPRALTNGTGGGYCEWLCTEGARQLSLSSQTVEGIRTAFANQPGDFVTRIYDHDAVIRQLFPLALVPNGLEYFVRHLVQVCKPHYGLTDEAIWWFLFARAEDPYHGVAACYLRNPAWQQEHPLALTRIGQAAFLKWMSKRYEITDPWIKRLDLGDYYAPAEQIKQLYVHAPALRTKYPNAFHDQPDTLALLIHLRRDLGVKFFFAEETWDRLVQESARSSPTPGVNVLGHFCYPCGLQQATTALVEGLHQAGVDASCRDVPGSLKFDLPGRDHFLGQEVHDISLLQVAPEPYFADCHAHAGLAPRPDVYRIASWYWELEEVPPHWARLGQLVREIWAPTRFIADALRMTMTVPVHHLLPGVQIQVDPSWTRRSFDLPVHRYLFLFAFDMCSVMERKNPLGLVRAYRQAFRRDDAVQLAIKVSRGSYEPDELKRLRAAADDAGVLILDRDMTRAESFGLINCCDAYVSLHRSEGFGLTMAEAMLMGKPVIATNYSGNLDFMTTENSRLVDFVKTPITQDLPIYRKGCLWAEPSVEHAAHWLRWAYDRQDEGRELGERAQRAMRELLSLKAAGERMAERLRQIREPVLV